MPIAFLPNDISTEYLQWLKLKTQKFISYRCLKLLPLRHRYSVPPVKQSDQLKADHDMGAS